MKKIFKHVVSLALVAFLLTPIFSFQIQGAAAQDFGFNEVKEGVSGTLPTENTDPRTIIGRIINIALGFLGVIAVGIILIGGFKWMTAAGNEDKVSEAKKLLGAGVIGLIIILAAWAISTWVIDAIYNAI